MPNWASCTVPIILSLLLSRHLQALSCINLALTLICHCPLICVKAVNFVLSKICSLLPEPCLCLGKDHPAPVQAAFIPTASCPSHLCRYAQWDDFTAVTTSQLYLRLFVGFAASTKISVFIPIPLQFCQSLLLSRGFVWMPALILILYNYVLFWWVFLHFLPYCH